MISRGGGLFVSVQIGVRSDATPGHAKITMAMNTYVHRDLGNVEKASQDSAGLYTRA